MSNLPTVVSEVRADLSRMDGEFRMALPPHIPVDKFRRVALTSIQSNPDLMRADRRSLFSACVKCAQDGLLPDGREAALVVFGNAVSYMPMVSGILKRVRNSGELASITSQIVYRNDTFRYWVDADGEHIQHEPLMFGERGDIVGVYALAKTKDGAVYIETMTKAQVEKVRSVSRTKNKGPWVDWWEEMARKTAIRRLSKRLPMSTDFVDQILSRDDDAPQEPAPPRPTREQFKALPAGNEGAGANSPADPGGHAPVTDVISEHAQAPAAQADEDGFAVYDAFGELASQHPTIEDATKAFRTLYEQEPEASRATLCEANPDLAIGAIGPAPSRTPAVDPATVDGNSTKGDDPSAPETTGSGGGGYSKWLSGLDAPLKGRRWAIVRPSEQKTRYFSPQEWVDVMDLLLTDIENDPHEVWTQNLTVNTELVRTATTEAFQLSLRNLADTAKKAIDETAVAMGGPGV